MKRTVPVRSQELNDGWQLDLHSGTAIRYRWIRDIA